MLCHWLPRKEKMMAAQLIRMKQKNLYHDIAEEDKAIIRACRIPLEAEKKILLRSKICGEIAI